MTLQTLQSKSRARGCLIAGTAGWQATGITAEVAARSPLWGLLQAPTAGFDVAAAAADIAAAGNEFVLDGVTVCGAPERGSFSLRFKCPSPPPHPSIAPAQNSTHAVPQHILWLVNALVHTSGW